MQNFNLVVKESLDHTVYSNYPAACSSESRRVEMSQSLQERNKAIAIEAFETLFNKRDYVTAEKFWVADYIQHASHLKQGREGLFKVARELPPDFHWDYDLIAAEGDLVWIHGRYSGRGVPTN
jgi:hypothetical protein